MAIDPGIKVNVFFSRSPQGRLFPVAPGDGVVLLK